MAQINKVKKLKMELRETVNKLLQNGETIDSVTDFLNKQGEEISRSTVGRYRQQWQEAVKDIEEARAFAEMTVERLANQSEDKVAILNAQLLETAFHRLLQALHQLEKNGEEPEKIIKLYERLAKAHKYVSSAHADDVDTTIKKNDYALDSTVSNETEENKALTVNFEG
ncbi:MAG: DUF3486 family protein [Mailhella sp.]|nr:DUF3486 family protein [Mailhella sp.]